MVTISMSGEAVEPCLKLRQKPTEPRLAYDVADNAYDFAVQVKYRTAGVAAVVGHRSPSPAPRRRD